MRDLATGWTAVAPAEDLSALDLETVLALRFTACFFGRLLEEDACLTLKEVGCSCSSCSVLDFSGNDFVLDRVV